MGYKFTYYKDKVGMFKNVICNCANCNKEIDGYAYNNFIGYAYKLPKVHNWDMKTDKVTATHHIFCSWSCLRKFEKEHKDLIGIEKNVRSKTR